MTHYDPNKSSVSKYAWVVIIASIVFAVILIIYAGHNYRAKRATRLKRQKEVEGAEGDRGFGGMVTEPLTAPAPASRHHRGRSLVQTN